MGKGRGGIGAEISWGSSGGLQRTKVIRPTHASGLDYAGGRRGVSGEIEGLTLPGDRRDLKAETHIRNPQSLLYPWGREGRPCRSRDGADISGRASLLHQKRGTPDSTFRICCTVRSSSRPTPPPPPFADTRKTSCGSSRRSSQTQQKNPVKAPGARSHPSSVGIPLISPSQHPPFIPGLFRKSRSTVKNMAGRGKISKRRYPVLGVRSAAGMEASSMKERCPSSERDRRWNRTAGVSTFFEIGPRDRRGAHGTDPGHYPSIVTKV